MPPKRPLRRPPGPAVPPRTTLHTQELMLFSSPASGVLVEKRTSSINRRSSGASAAAAQPSSSSRSKGRSSSQRRQIPPSTMSTSVSSSGAPRRSAPEYEPLPEHYHTVPCAPTAYSSEIVPTNLNAAGAASSAAVTSSSSLLPSSLQRDGGVPSLSLSRSGGIGGKSRGVVRDSGGGIVASGSSSRVVRLLRDARAAVQDPIRPETPLDGYGTSATFQTVSNTGGDGTSLFSGFPRQPLHSLEPRLRRRLPAGVRLAPLPPSSSPSLSATATSPLSLPSTGLASQIDVRAQLYQHRQHDSATPAATATSPATTFNDAGGATGVSSLDADVFAKLYADAQQRGEEGILDSVHLLAQLKEWLAEPSSAKDSGATTAAAAAPHALNPAATACLQTTLLHFCEHWPTGAALRSAIDNYAVLRSSYSLGESKLSNGDERRLSRSLSFSIPLNYAEVALLAAAVMLRGHPASSLVAEPISFHALLTAVHTIADCGVAEWIAQESPVLGALVELLRVLTSMQSTVKASSDKMQQLQQWIWWILDIFVCCCEEAAFPTASNTHIGRDMIRGCGLAEDADAIGAFLPSQQQQQRAVSASLMSSTASLHRVGQRPTSRPGSHSPICSSLTSQSSPLGLLRHGSGGERDAQFQQSSASSLKVLTTHLLSLGLLELLSELSTRNLTQQQAATLPASAAPSSLLPIIGSLYRFMAQFHAESLRRSGVITTLTVMLQVGAGDTATVESAARALVKLTFDDDCLQAMQASGLTLLDAAAHALLAQMRLHTDVTNHNTNDVSTNTSTVTSSIDLLVSRLCGVVARVAEDSAALQEHLATPAMTHLLEVLAQRYLSRTNTATTSNVSFTTNVQTSPPPMPLPPWPVLQSIIWVLGIAAMSPKCSLHLVETVTPLLISLLQRLREASSSSSSSSTTRTTAVYVLMCLSNLSYFFNRFEPQLLQLNAVAAAQVEGECEAAVHAEWLSTICDALCFSLAGYFFEDNVEATVEATRILGNISYTNTGRDWMETNRCDEVVVLFLGHEDLRIAYNCCGILLNLTAAWPCRVVGDPELLRMMLSYTSRYTKDVTIAAAAALEKARLHKQRLQQGLPANGTGIGVEVTDRECAAEASSSASQIADLVEKLLMNVQGLLSLPAPTAGSDDI